MRVLDLLHAFGSTDMVLQSWAKPENHHLTDTLLTLIEDNATYKVAFGFDKGDVGSIPTGGKKLGEHHQSLACALFINEVNPSWSEEDIPQLKDTVKNRILSYLLFYLTFSMKYLLTMFVSFSLKTNYKKHRSEMSETGQGLLDEGREDEITQGSELANVWGL